MEQQKHIDREFGLSDNKFIFSASFLTVIVLFVILYMVCKPVKLKTLIIGLAMYRLQIKTKVVNAIPLKRVKSARKSYADANKNGGQYVG